MTRLRRYSFHVFMLVAIALLLTLGTWQVQRLQWKNARVEAIQAQLAEPEWPLTDVGALDEADIYRRVSATGTFLHDEEVHLYTGNIAYKSKIGYDIITPLVLTNGQVVLVDRGWVPAELKAQETRPETLVEGEEGLSAMLMPGEQPGWFTPENDISGNLWFWLDIPAVSASKNIELPPYFLRALITEGAEKALPRAGEANIQLRNDHLHYAITWYALALIAAVFYGLFLRKVKKQ